MVANRSVGVGLTAAAVISSWLYSTALLGASLLTYKFGVALGVWWGASASTMVCFLAFLSIEAKRRAPHAHTLLELIKVRYGKFAHILWIVFCLVNNILVFSSMLLGASTAVTSLTGMPVLASTYLMPVSHPTRKQLYYEGVVNKRLGRRSCLYILWRSSSNILDRLYPHFHYHDYPCLVHNQGHCGQGDWIDRCLVRCNCRCR